ncbi:hypothetical protein T05_11542 [Trichinella murrelli]|uniref:Uncharacterized protein n=1 Tax=Trichinella murrelli TaxID=144512 RepID=A0A0V0T5Q6_9BILA|nr:hypothetical protein T05_11542 [Trichinella murrelli]
MKSICLMKTLWEQFNMQIQFWECQMEIIFNTNECHSMMRPLLFSVKTSKSTCCQMQKIHPSVIFTSQCDGTVAILGLQKKNASLTFMLKTGLIFSTPATSVWEKCKGKDCESALPGTTDSRAIFSLLTAFHDAVGKLKSTLLDLGGLTTLRKHV